MSSSGGDGQDKDEVQVSATGSASASEGAAATTGYRGSKSADSRGIAARVHVSETGDATASHGGLANTGYIHEVHVDRLTLVHQRAPTEPVPWPHQVGLIPTQALSFQHREVGDQLRSVVAANGTTILGQVLTGMGGVGKTQLAADFARGSLTAGDLDVLVWVTASSRSSIIGAYAQAGIELCCANPNDVEVAARTFLAWLTTSGHRPCRWLIVLDDVADPDDLHTLWPPSSPSGRTLVTTRRRDAALTGEGRLRIDVGLFSQTEAHSYLTARLSAHGHPAATSEVSALARDLGYLPLALAQAAAYLIDSGLSIHSYRSRLANHSMTLESLTPDRLPDEQQIPLAAVWAVSVERADTLPPTGLARPMLELASVLNWSGGVPQIVLTSPSVLAYLPRRRASLTKRRRRRRRAEYSMDDPPVTAEEAARALRALHRLSLVDHDMDEDGGVVRVHQLVRRVTNDAVGPELVKRGQRLLVDGLATTFDDYQRWKTAKELRTKIRGCMDLTEKLLAHATQVLGPEHPDTISLQSDLAYWRRHFSDADVDRPQSAAEKASTHAGLLTLRRRLLGVDHPDTLAAWGSLAHWRGEAGDPAGAAAENRELLNHLKRTLTDGHPHLLLIQHNLEHWERMAGQDHL